MIKVKTANILDKYRLEIKFSDKTSGIADFSSHINHKPFLILRDEHIFQNIVIEHDSIKWPKGNINIATEALYALVHQLLYHFKNINEQQRF